MSDNEGAQPTEEILAAIRADSAEARLASLSALRIRLARPEGSEAADIESMISEAADDDIKLMRGSKDVYFFSESLVTHAYAKLLFRSAENDPQRLVAETVRDESSSYPRPTPLSLFTAAPFNMSLDEVDRIVASMGAAVDYADIKRTTASNGDAFLYSSTFMGAAHADSLAEWIAVGIGENP